MTSTPSTTNKLATLVNALIAGLDKSILGVVYAAIIADVPWLGLPGIKQIWTWLFSWIASYFTVAAENGATFLIIDLQTGAEQTKLSAAMKQLIAAEQSGDPNAIKAAIQAYANANSALIHDDGSAPAQS
jgi:hypothetical protein